MATGTVKMWSEAKGFGFIRPDVRSEPDVFVHFTGIVGNGDAKRNLHEGAAVSYEVVQGEKGLQASSVREI